MIDRNDVELRWATEADHLWLHPLYASYYAPHHPLFHAGFWQWQFGEEGDARCLVASYQGQPVAHLGVKERSGIAWLINILIHPDFRGGDLADRLFALARTQGQLAVAVANSAGSRLLARKKWFRYADLCRYVLLHPDWSNGSYLSLMTPSKLQLEDWHVPKGSYYTMPGLHAIAHAEAGMGVVQEWVSGLRVIEINDTEKMSLLAWQCGFRWMDFVCSWNDPRAALLEKAGWKVISDFPWFIDPVDTSQQIVLNLFSEEPLPRDFLFHRTYADMLRVGRL